MEKITKETFERLWSHRIDTVDARIRSRYLCAIKNYNGGHNVGIVTTMFFSPVDRYGTTYLEVSWEGDRGKIIHISSISVTDRDIVLCPMV